jgi:DNA-binding MarR family transcriptional regulator
MAAEGKRLPLTLKVMACLAAGILVAWVVTTLLDTYFNMPLLADTKGWLLRAGDWLLLETPMPNWSLMLIIATLIGTLSVAIYYTRSPDGAGGELHEIERKVYKKNNPQFPQLTENQTLLMEVLAYHANYRKIASLDSVCKLVSISTLEVEVGLKQLEAKRLVKRSATRGTFGATTFSLTVAGKDYALERFELT